jgi:hypothetical protein
VTVLQSDAIGTDARARQIPKVEMKAFLAADADESLRARLRATSTTSGRDDADANHSR